MQLYSFPGMIILGNETDCPSIKKLTLLYYQLTEASMFLYIPCGGNLAIYVYIVEQHP